VWSKKDSGAIWPLYSRAYIEHNKLSSSIRSGLYIERRYAKRKEEEKKSSFSPNVEIESSAVNNGNLGEKREQHIFFPLRGFACTCISVVFK
jgi:hypothetical protein